MEPGYFGEFPATLDDKGRVTMPRQFREIMNVLKHHSWYMTRGFDNCVFLFHEAEWARIRKQASGFTVMHGKALDFNRMFFGSVAETKPDQQGRMNVPAHLREYAGLQKEAVIIGVDNHLELWSKDKWRAFQSAHEDTYKEMASQLFMGVEEPPAGAVEGEVGHAN